MARPAHDTARTDEESRREFGFVPSQRFDRAALGKARIAVATHRKMEAELERSPRPGVLLKADGKRRSVVFVDETPGIAKLLPVEPSDVWTFRDRVRSTDPEHPMVDVLTAIAGRMETACAKAREGAAFVGVQLVEGEEEARLFQGETAASLKRFASTIAPEQRRIQAEPMAAVARFIRAAADGYVFLCSHHPVRIIAYELGFSPFMAGIYPLERCLGQPCAGGRSSSGCASPNGSPPASRIRVIPSAACTHSPTSSAFACWRSRRATRTAFSPWSCSTARGASSPRCCARPNVPAGWRSAPFCAA